MIVGPNTLVDVHAHFVTDRYVAAATAAGHSHPDGMPGWPSWSVGAHLDMMDANGIGVAMLSISSPGTHFGDDAAARALSREVNEFGAGVMGDHPGRFGHFASLPLPDIDGSLAEIDYALDILGSDGVTVETNAHGRYLGDPAFAPVWTELDRRGAAVFVHPTSPPAPEVALGRPSPMLEFLFDSARTVSDLLFTGVFARHRRIRWIFTHGAGALPLLADRLEMFRSVLGSGDPSDSTVHALLRELWFDMAGTPFPHQIPAYARVFAPERLLYGSDYCWTPAPLVAAQIAAIDSAPQPDSDTWRNLTTRNARLLFGRLDSMRSEPISTASR